KQSRVSCKGFKATKLFQANVTERSILEGEIEAEKVDLTATKDGSVVLKGSAKEAKISASERGRLFLPEFALDHAEVTLKNGSTAVIKVNARLDYDLSASSRLEYLGSPVSTKGRTLDGSLALQTTLE